MERTSSDAVIHVKASSVVQQVRVPRKKVHCLGSRRDCSILTPSTVRAYFTLTILYMRLAKGQYDQHLLWSWYQTLQLFMYSGYYELSPWLERSPELETRHKSITPRDGFRNQDRFRRISTVEPFCIVPGVNPNQIFTFPDQMPPGVSREGLEYQATRNIPQFYNLCAHTTRYYKINYLKDPYQPLIRDIFGAVRQIVMSGSMFSLEPSSGRSSWVECLFSVSSAMASEQQEHVRERLIAEQEDHWCTILAIREKRIRSNCHGT